MLNRLFLVVMCRLGYELKHNIRH